MADAKTFVRGSYTWSHYYGNFDQDNSTVGNDANIFIGSSNIADGAGRQLWDFRDGDLRGDRPHCSRSTAIYVAVRGTRPPARSSSRSPASRGRRGATSRTGADDVNTSDTTRYAEPAGSRAHRRALRRST